MLQQLHLNDRKAIASQLQLPLEDFDNLVQSANRAYEFIKIMGPFYGRDDTNNEPTFRTTAEPVRLPVGSKRSLTDFGNDLLQLGYVLPRLPHAYKSMIGNENLDFRVALSWRIDSIIDKHNNVRINEIEGIDSVSALLMVEQLAYGLQPLRETTIMRFIEAIKKIYLISEERPPLKIAIPRNDLANNPFNANARRFVELVKELSQGMIICELFDIDALRNKAVTPDWDEYSAVINESYASPMELEALGISKSKLLSAGNYNALFNKGVFALIHEPALATFWKKELGNERYERLKTMLIPSKFITTVDELAATREEGKVAKVTWADGDMIIVNRAKGVAMPTGDIDESADDRWNFLRECLEKGHILIAQEYVEPAQISAYLRKRGTSLEPVTWYNRLCVKYVVDGNPNGEVLPAVNLTATEVTLGPEVIPAGRKCAFTAGIFV